jgi:pimeloyl-ACP methyl ester carboxylesterase
MKNKQVLVVLMALLAAACGRAVEREAVGTRSYGSQEARVEEISFRSGRFRLVGDLRMPVGEGPHPAIIMVHGDGPVTRDGYPTTFLPAMEVFLRNGYAVFSWDKPGSGESKGAFNRRGEYDVLTRRAAILADGFEVLAELSAIDPSRIGLWGISQAGWVMPMALDRMGNVAFMIVVSGGGECSPEQMAYQIGQQVACGGGSAEQAALVERYWAQSRNATTYAEYREAMEILMEISGFEVHTGITLTLAEEDDWRPYRRDTDSFFDPIEVIEHTTIPVLAFFGGLDKNVDPVQGAEAYEAALQEAGNPDYQVVSIPGVAHTLTPAETGCIGEQWGSEVAPEYLDTMEAWLQHVAP